MPRFRAFLFFSCLFFWLHRIRGNGIVERRLDLFAAANGATNGGCASFRILDPPGHYAGYFPIEGTEDGHLFYIYFENRYADPDAPFVFWTNGGPGCSSFFGVFLENGPYDIQEDGTLCWKEHGWDIGHNIVFVEQPINVGFSYSREASDAVHGEWRIGADVVQFLYGFLEAHPELAEKDLYLTGQSYAGHYLPFIATAIQASNAVREGPHLNLKGIFVSNPWISPVTQYPTNPIFAFNEGLIDAALRDRMLQDWPSCAANLRLCDHAAPWTKRRVCQRAYDDCQAKMLDPVTDLHPTLNYYDVRRYDCNVPSCYDVSTLKAVLNDPAVQAALGVEEDILWRECNAKVRQDVMWDWATDVTSLYTALLNAGIRISIPTGNKDLVCNNIGEHNFIDGLDWYGAAEWNATETVPLVVNGKVVGYIRELASLSFVHVLEAGHMVPMDQPALARELLTAFTRGRSYLSVPALVGEPREVFGRRIIIS